MYGNDQARKPQGVSGDAGKREDRASSSLSDHGPHSCLLLARRKACNNMRPIDAAQPRGGPPAAAGADPRASDCTPTSAAAGPPLPASELQTVRCTRSPVHTPPTSRCCARVALMGADRASAGLHFSMHRAERAQRDLSLRQGKAPAFKHTYHNHACWRPLSVSRCKHSRGIRPTGPAGSWPTETAGRAAVQRAARASTRVAPPRPSWPPHPPPLHIFPGSCLSRSGLLARPTEAWSRKPHPGGRWCCCTTMPASRSTTSS